MNEGKSAAYEIQRCISRGDYLKAMEFAENALRRNPEFLVYNQLAQYCAFKLGDVVKFNLIDKLLRALSVTNQFKAEFSIEGKDFWRRYELINRHPKFFHKRWYVKTYSDMYGVREDPVKHYLKIGAYIGCNPTSKFDSSYYIENYLTSSSAERNPLVHYLKYGRKENIETDATALAKKKIDLLTVKLLNFGFTEKPLQELHDIISSNKNHVMRAMAAHLLGIWYMRYSPSRDLASSQKFLRMALDSGINNNFRKGILNLYLLSLYYCSDKDLALKTFQIAMAEKLVSNDTYLLMSNFEDDLQVKLSFINSCLEKYSIPRVSIHKSASCLYDSLDVPSKSSCQDNVLITVLIAAYNSEKTIAKTIESLKKQTWKNFEAILLNDRSTDNTKAEAVRAIGGDRRFKLVDMKINSGAYVCRNYGLSIAKGEFVTLNDADDWSHCLKLEVQANFLLDNPEVIGCTSEQARATDDLIFDTIRKSGNLIIPNISSFMFRKEKVVSAVGYWDSVRFGADVQFIDCIKAHFGNKAVVNIPTGPLSFQRQSESSATGISNYGYDGFKFGARRVYEDFHRAWMGETNSYFIDGDIGGNEVLFAPNPMRALKEHSNSTARHFDVIIASDFRFDGGTSSSNAEEIKAQKLAGLRTGLVELHHYGFGSKRMMNKKIRSLIDGESVELLCFGEEATCDVLIIRQPMVLTEPQRYIPKISADRVYVIINQPPKRDYSDEGETLYTLEQAAVSIKSMFGNIGKWYPIGPLVRDSLFKFHSAELKFIDLAEENWTNIINLEEWTGTNNRAVSRSLPIRIGRHSRDQDVKWPESRELINLCYPLSNDFEIHVLGGAESPKRVLDGELPKNWIVHEFGCMEPVSFLNNIDIFVYFTHVDWIEAFGRVIFEPMAAGIPVILPSIYEPLFKKAAIYAEPEDVEHIARELWRNRAVYDNQVALAREILKRDFSYDTHIKRLSFN